MNYTDRDLIELACRAPACPEWFEPDMSAFKPNIPEDLARLFEDAFSEANFHKLPRKGAKDFEAYCEWRIKWGQRNAAYQREKLTQWPKAYARMVLESK